jgi:tetratricopeptide (TPR) repeat protein
VNFGHNRSEALALCDGKADYAWMIDADDNLDGEMILPNTLDVDGYSLLITRGNFEWWRHQIFRTGQGWKYVGVLHEYAMTDKPNARHERLIGKYKIQARTEGARNVGISPVEKYSRDAEVLEKALETEPTNTRYWFYLAQSYFDSQQWQKAYDAYKKRAELGGWEEECYYSLFRMAIITVITEKPWIEIQQHFLNAWAYRPIRAEPLFELSRLYRAAGNPRLAYLYASHATKIPFPQTDILFLIPELYDWQVWDELSATAYYTYRFDEGYEACKRVVMNPRVPESERKRVMQNMIQYEDRLREINEMRQKWEAEQKKNQPEVPTTPKISGSFATQNNKKKFKVRK